MNGDNSDKIALRLLDKIYNELINIEAECSDYLINERLTKLIHIIENETLKNKTILLDLIHIKIKETKLINPDLNSRFYILYRNLSEDKITTMEAQSVYEMYAKELDNNWLL